MSIALPVEVKYYIALPACNKFYKVVEIGWQICISNSNPVKWLKIMNNV